MRSKVGPHSVYLTQNPVYNSKKVWLANQKEIVQQFENNVRSESAVIFNSSAEIDEIFTQLNMEDRVRRGRHATGRLIKNQQPCEERLSLSLSCFYFCQLLF